MTAGKGSTRRKETKQERKNYDKNHSQIITKGREMKYIDFNLNHYIKVKLCNKGHAILKEQWDELRKIYPKLSGEYQPKEVDDEGYSKFQMHDFMNIFGPFCYAGSRVPNCNVKIQIKEENQTKTKEGNKMTEKTLDNCNESDTKKKVTDVIVLGNTDSFILLCKASSKNEGWMKSTKVCETQHGCFVQVTTQQRNPDGSYSVAEALTFAAGVTFDDLNK